MLDERTSLLLEKINDLCKEGGFRVVEESELLSSFSGVSLDREELLRILRYLETRRFIEIRYAEDGVYCLCPLPEGRSYFETLRETRRETARRRREVFFLTAIGALSGGFLGSLAAALVAFWVGI